MDKVFMGTKAPSLITTWIPFGFTPKIHGSLSIIPGSHSSPLFDSIQKEYGQYQLTKKIYILDLL